jgi:hypothetical protein
VKQDQRLFEMKNIELTFADEALNFVEGEEDGGRPM